jgi:hypothetical protein
VAPKNDFGVNKNLRSWKLAVVNAFLCSPATTPENSLDNTKQCATLLGLQVRSVVARVKFSHEETWGLYRTLGEQLKKRSSFLLGNLQNMLLVLRPQLHRVVVNHKVLNVSKIK